MSMVAPSCTAGDDDAVAEDCPKGNKGCRCKSDDSCNSGLACNDDGKCVTAGQGGSAGAATTLGGGAGRSNGGRAGTESFSRAGSKGHPTGGTTADAGAGGEPSTGGTLGRGTGGAGNATGQSGESSSAGESGGPGSGGTNPGSGGTGGTGNAGMGGSPPCTPITTTILDKSVSSTTTLNSANLSSVFTPDFGDELTDDVVSLQLYDGVFEDVNYHGADLGTFELGTGLDDNYDTCARCVIAGIDGGQGKRFFATEGTLTFASDSDQINGYPHGTLRNVVLREATFNDTTFHSTLVPGGACLTLANGDLLTNVTPPPPLPSEWTCDTGFYADGSFCDCGCGALDPDCSSPSYAACEYCYCPGDDEDCTVNTVDHSDTSQCLSP